ncbi:PorP/SprF family type IX secretion system membrane protein [Flammeovirga yaeyamensis]|uniref:PorP/SprF family type IX secretion system membrane protein n=1 Tax=Flammeovirga yaeyamensis TaxID=367791 RepID=A0AAX1MXJ5_9BACT|nr:type IX secretion system membrane protein PorP/SprF [Flammeovirga yaeyamensis]MBB3696457.1 type IX secretion system PorP/SprF family membrane protein [Flammeovirga yaeyamensis]NMF35135.1 type IX secretion system membrane protein PorP/SprF [Flammeovirga yaeyamensis]QWG00045.1 PorP/SprF family type IX secretion system membrane protein [Flammeovirga yaeyamensis]
MRPDFKNYCSYLIILISVLAYGKTFAQDTQFSQYYATPLYLNPALTGSTGETRAIVNYRNQWVGLPAGIQSFIASFDHNFKYKRFSLGAIIKNDNYGVNEGTPLKHSSFTASGSYTIPINKYTGLNVGLQVGYGQNKLDIAALVFNDQLDSFGFTGGATNEPFIHSQRSYADVNSGVMLYGEKYWVGIGYYHMNRPNISFIGERNFLPSRITIEGGYMIPLEYKGHRTHIPDYKRKSMTLAVHYQSQGKNDQLSIGGYFHYQPLLIGVWYRGLPLIKSAEKDNAVNHDAIVLLTGVKIGNLNFGYSYDITMSDLPQQHANSHEISLQYTFNLYKDYRKKPKRKPMDLPCPSPIL